MRIVEPVHCGQSLFLVTWFVSFQGGGGGGNFIYLLFFLFIKLGGGIQLGHESNGEKMAAI